MEWLSNFIYDAIDLMGIYGPVLSCLLILIESIFPVLPLGVFITINFLAYGHLVGFIISWIFTVLGCLISFYIFRRGVSGWFSRLTKDKDTLNNLMLKFNNITLPELTVIIAIPFTPAFLVNIAAGLSNMDFKKFFTSILIGKLGLVYFWGYIGTSVVESFQNPMVLIKIAVILIITYIISVVLKKALKL